MSVRAVRRAAERGRARHRHVGGDRQPGLRGTRSAPRSRTSRPRTGRAPACRGPRARAAPAAARHAIARARSPAAALSVAAARALAGSARSAAPRKQIVNGFGAARDAVEHQPARRRGSGGLEISTMCRVAGVGVERVDRHQRGDRADLGLEVAAAGADGVADAAAGARDQAGHFLHAGARRADDADVAARHRVGESERRAGDDRGAAVRAHHQQAALARLALERDLVLERHVVGEDHARGGRARAPCAPRRRRNGPAPRSARGWRRAVCAHRAAERCATRQRRRRGLLARLRRAGASPPRSRPRRRPHRSARSARIRSLGSAASPSAPSRPASRRMLLVGRRADHQPGLLDAGQRGDCREIAHQRDRVEIGGAADLVDDHAHRDAHRLARRRPAPARSRRAAPCDAGADLADAGLAVRDAGVDGRREAGLDHAPDVDAGRHAGEIQRRDGPVRIVRRPRSRAIARVKRGRLAKRARRRQSRPPRAPPPSRRRRGRSSRRSPSRPCRDWRRFSLKPGK